MEKINLVELLKDCIGMELDCAVFNNVRLEKINSEEDRDFPIRVNTLGGYTISLTKYGTYIDSPEAKCLIFPKGKTTWEGFQRPFKDGDIIYNRLQKKICIYYLCEDEVPRINGCRYNESNIQLQFEKLEYPIPIAMQDYRFATEEEKQRLFDSIKAHGYIWYPEAKILEKLVEPQFKDGDIVTCKDGGLLVACIYKERKNTASFNHHIALYKGCLGVLVNGEIALTDDKLSFATEEEKAKLFKAIKYKGYKWNEEAKTLEELPKFKVGDRIRQKNRSMAFI